MYLLTHDLNSKVIKIKTSRLLRVMDKIKMTNKTSL